MTRFVIYSPVGVPKVPRRNMPCPCGSGRKFKRCCLIKRDVARQEALDRKYSSNGTGK